MELLIVIVVVGILAAVAIPNYSAYLLKNKVKVAEGDLVALSVALENGYQRTLTYTTGPTGATIAATSTTSATQTAVGSNWAPAQGADFTYTISAITASSYTLLATATNSQLSGCYVVLSQGGTRSFASGGTGSDTSAKCLQSSTTW